MEENKKIRIPIRVIVMMGTVGLLYDFLQALTTAGIIGFILSTLITIWAWLHFYIWYKFRGVGFFEGKAGKFIARRILPFVVPMILEFIPAWNIVPTLSLAVVVTGILVYLEDKAVQKNIISEEDLKKFQKYVKKNKRILSGRFKKEDWEALYQYGKERTARKLKNTPHGERIAEIARAAQTALKPSFNLERPPTPQSQPRIVDLPKSTEIDGSQESSEYGSKSGADARIEAIRKARQSDPYGNPSWAQDTDVNRRVRLHNDRIAVGQRLGMDTGEAVQKANDAERRDRERRKAA